MEVLVKVWYKNNEEKCSFYKEHNLLFSDNELDIIKNNIKNIKNIEEIGYLIKPNLNIPKEKISAFSWMNGIIDIKINKIVILLNIYVVKNYLRILKIENFENIMNKEDGFM